MEESKIAAIYVHLDELMPNPNNPRKDLPIKEVAISIKDLGFGAPIVARLANKMIIAGHTRYYACKDILGSGYEHVPCRYMDVSQEIALKMGLADNKLGELARWEDEQLSTLLVELEKETDIKNLGWSESELDKLLEKLRDEPPAPEEPITTTTEADSKTGELYTLGEHILICGDSSSQEIWDALLAAAGTAPTMALTDPPYDVGYNISWNKKRLDNDAGLQTKYQEAGPKRWSSAPDDPLAAEPADILGSVLPLMPDLVVMTYPVDRHFWKLADITKAAEYISIRGLVWCKSRASFHPAATYQQQHEPVLVLRRKGQKYPTSIPAGTTTVIMSEDALPVHTDHPTEKPIDVWSKLLKWHSEYGDTIIDPFAGSGTTLIAAALSGRRALLIEKNEHFCDLIRSRWTTHCAGAK